MDWLKVSKHLEKRARVILAQAEDYGPNNPSDRLHAASCSIILYDLSQAIQAGLSDEEKTVETAPGG